MSGNALYTTITFGRRNSGPERSTTRGVKGQVEVIRLRLLCNAIQSRKKLWNVTHCRGQGPCKGHPRSTRALILVFETPYVHQIWSEEPLPLLGSKVIRVNQRSNCFKWLAHLAKGALKYRP